MNARTALQLSAILTVAAFSFSTRSVHAEATQSVNAIPIITHKPPIGFTWDEFGVSVVAGAVGGALGGAMATALFGTPAGTVGALSGGLVGAVGAAASNAASQLAGATSASMLQTAPEHALD